MGRSSSTAAGGGQPSYRAAFPHAPPSPPSDRLARRGGAAAGCDGSSGGCGWGGKPPAMLVVRREGKGGQVVESKLPVLWTVQEGKGASAREGVRQLVRSAPVEGSSKSAAEGQLGGGGGGQVVGSARCPYWGDGGKRRRRARSWEGPEAEWCVSPDVPRRMAEGELSALLVGLREEVLEVGPGRVLALEAKQDKAKGAQAVQALLVPAQDSRFFKTLWGRLVEERGADLSSLTGTEAMLIVGSSLLVTHRPELEEEEAEELDERDRYLRQFGAHYWDRFFRKGDAVPYAEAPASCLMGKHCRLRARGSCGNLHEGDADWIPTTLIRCRNGRYCNFHLSKSKRCAYNHDLETGQNTIRPRKPERERERARERWDGGHHGGGGGGGEKRRRY